MIRGAALIVAGALLLAGDSTPAQQPLPDQEAFLADVRDNLLSAQRRQYTYAYKERRTDLHMNPFGRIGTKGQTQVKDLGTEAAAEAHVGKLIGEKTRKGYAEVLPG